MFQATNHLHVNRGAIPSNLSTMRPPLYVSNPNPNSRRTLLCRNQRQLSQGAVGPSQARNKIRGNLLSLLCSNFRYAPLSFFFLLSSFFFMWPHLLCHKFIVLEGPLQSTSQSFIPHPIQHYHHHAPSTITTTPAQTSSLTFSEVHPIQGFQHLLLPIVLLFFLL